MSFYYSAYGLKLHSELPLPELLVLDESERHTVDVVIRRGQCKLPDKVLLRESYGHLHDGVADLYWRGTGSFRIREHEIVVEPTQGVADHLLRPFLLGAALGTTLHLRRHLVLHCSSIALPNGKGELGVVAFIGQSGQGKSTMATALKAQGYPVVADDIIAVPIPEDFSDLEAENERASLTIHPGPPYLKLRQPSVETFGKTLDQLTRWRPDDDSYVLPHESQFSAPPLSLSCLYLLAVGETVEIQEMEPQDQLMALVNHSYCVRILGKEEVAHNFFQCSWLMRQVPFFRIQRPHDFSYLPEVVRRVEEHQRSL